MLNILRFEKIISEAIGNTKDKRELIRIKAALEGSLDAVCFEKLKEIQQKEAI